MRTRYAIALLAGTLAIYLVAGSARLFRYHGDADLISGVSALSAFAGFGCVPNGPCFARDNAAVLPDGALLFSSGGYDGQFYYYLAAEIYGGFEEYSAVLDADAFRRARIGYPLLTGWAGVFGPRSLLIAMVLLPLLLHLLSVALLCHWTAGLPGLARIALVIYALNPVSLFSWLYLLADGVALTLLVLSFATGLRFRYNRLVSAALLALAVLTKEHALVGVGVFAVSGVAQLLRSGPRSRARTLAFGDLGVAAWASLVLLGWWLVIGFSPEEAAVRGGWPFAGVWLYLSGAPDAVLSGRSYLVLYLLAWLTLAGIQAAIMIQRFLRSIARGPALRCGWPRPQSAAVLAGFCAGLTLLSFATAHEYWSNYANILRLFAPGFAVLVLFAMVRPAVFRTGRPRAPRILLGMRVALYACMVATLASLHGILKSEISGRLQPTERLEKRLQ